MYKQELKRILDASEKNALTFFVGAGISRISDVPTWNELIHAFCKELDLPIKCKYCTDELLQIPQMYYYSIRKNKEQFNNFVKAQLDKPGFAPNEIHHRMFSLNPASFITTNYDTLIEETAVARCQGFKVISRDKDVPTIYGDKFILKIHGDFKYNNYVLKEEDYLNYSDNFRLVETLAKSIFSTNRVVFIGYRLNDYNIKLIINWTKTLLKEKYREPIFIYADERELRKTELQYHKSRGLSVIDLNKLTHSKSSDYLSKYNSFFEALMNASKITTHGNSEDEAFEIVYKLLKPLNRLNAIRVEDVSRRLIHFAIINSNGVIVLIHKDGLALKQFFKIFLMSEQERMSLSDDILNKFNCILSVFKKARIKGYYGSDNNPPVIFDETSLGDRNCILFDYNALSIYSSKKYKTIKENFKKAFYLSCLKNYREALTLFSDVAKSSFKSNNYPMYYLAEANCIELRKKTEVINIEGKQDSGNGSEVPTDTEMENLFRNLPVEFRNEYKEFRNIHSTNMLYEYSYKAFIEGQRLQNNIDKRAEEAFFTTSKSIRCTIYNYLHFLLGNGIVAIDSLIFKNTIKYLISLLVCKYSNQGKKNLRERILPFENNDLIEFDEVDFYCFIECFASDEIDLLFRKNHIETIEFQNMNMVELAVNNLLDYYDSFVKTPISRLANIEMENQVRSCITLLGYMNISQSLVDKVCAFILTNEFDSIWIDDKVKFLHRQLYIKKMYSRITKKTIEDALISYIDQHINALEKKESFVLHTHSTNINYRNLIEYIYESEEEHISRRLSIQISRILSDNLTELFPDIIEFYSIYMTDYQKKDIVVWANKKLNEVFDFRIFMLLMDCKATINSATIERLKAFLKNSVKSTKVEQFSNQTNVPSSKRPYEELEFVGYLCFIKSLNKNDFTEFLGVSTLFDFYYQYEDFDFSRFDISWLTNRFNFNKMLNRISQNGKVRKEIRKIIASELQNNDIATPDRHRLQDILVEYFC